MVLGEASGDWRGQNMCVMGSRLASSFDETAVELSRDCGGASLRLKWSGSREVQRSSVPDLHPES